MLNIKSSEIEKMSRGISVQYRVVELDVVNVLLQELTLSDNFFKFFMKKMKLDAENSIVKYVGRSIIEKISPTHPEYNKYHGENDMVVIYTNKLTGRDSAILIEVKIDAIKMPEQPERYLARCEKYQQVEFEGKSEHNFEHCDNVIFATKAYFADAKNEAKKYNHHILLVDIINDYYKKKMVRTALDEYNMVLLEKAENKISLPDPNNHALILGWREYLKYLQENHLWLRVLLLTDRLESRHEDTVGFIFDTAHGHGHWEIGAHISTGKYYLQFVAFKNDELQNELFRRLQKACVDAGRTELIPEILSDRVRIKLEIKERFRYKELFVLENENIKPTDLAYEELLNLDVSLDNSKIPLLEKSVEAVMELYKIVDKLDIDEIVELYAKYKRK